MLEKTWVRFLLGVVSMLLISCLATTAFTGLAVVTFREKQQIDALVKALALLHSVTCIAIITIVAKDAGFTKISATIKEEEIRSWIIILNSLADYFILFGVPIGMWLTSTFLLQDAFYLGAAGAMSFSQGLYSGVLEVSLLTVFARVYNQLPFKASYWATRNS